MSNVETEFALGLPLVNIIMKESKFCALLYICGLNVVDKNIGLSSYIHIEII